MHLEFVLKHESVDKLVFAIFCVYISVIICCFWF